MKKVNIVNFMHHGKVQFRFKSTCPEIIDWLKQRGYQNFTKYELNTTHPGYWDDRLQEWLVGYVSSDQIWARSKQEADMIYRYLVENP